MERDSALRPLCVNGRLPVIPRNEILALAAFFVGAISCVTSLLTSADDEPAKLAVDGPATAVDGPATAVDDGPATAVDDGCVLPNANVKRRLEILRATFWFVFLSVAFSRYTECRRGGGGRGTNNAARSNSRFLVRPT